MDLTRQELIERIVKAIQNTMTNEELEDLANSSSFGMEIEYIPELDIFRPF